MPDTVVDVSPDLSFGVQMGGQNTGGRIVTVAADPNDRLRLYAAGELSGVWTSGDGGLSWRQTGRGLGNGNSCSAPPVLAVDPRNHRRLLYTTFQDFRPNNPTAGLYLSTDQALTWARVPLPVGIDKGHGTVGFAVGPAGEDHPWVLTAGGLLVADTKTAGVRLTTTMAVGTRAGDQGRWSPPPPCSRRLQRPNDHRLQREHRLRRRG